MVAKPLAWEAPERMTRDWHVKLLAATLMVEDTLSKQAIFDSYLEAVPLGNSIRGVGAGAAAYLATIARSPNRFTSDARAALDRRDLVWPGCWKAGPSPRRHAGRHGMSGPRARQISTIPALAMCGRLHYIGLAGFSRLWG